MKHFEYMNRKYGGTQRRIYRAEMDGVEEKIKSKNRCNEAR